MIMAQEKPDGGALELGETVVPMYVDQSRDALDPNKTVSKGQKRGEERPPLMQWALSCE